MASPTNCQTHSTAIRPMQLRCLTIARSNSSGVAPSAFARSGTAVLMTPMGWRFRSLTVKSSTFSGLSDMFSSFHGFAYQLSNPQHRHSSNTTVAGDLTIE